MAFKLNDKILRLDAPFSVGNTNYPANWLRLSTADEKTALGITEVEDPKVYNSRFIGKMVQKKQLKMSMLHTQKMTQKAVIKKAI